MRTTREYALAGVASAAAGLGAGHFVASLVDPRTSPAAAVGSAAIDVVPRPLKDWGIATFGSYDKTVLVATVVLVTLGMAALVGVLARRSLPLALTASTLLALIPTAIASSRYGAAGALTGAVTALVGGAVLVALAQRMTPPDPGRRRFLTTTTALAGGAALAAIGALIPDTTPTARRAIPSPATRRPPLPEGLERQVPVSPLQTPVKDFYRIDIALVPPKVNPEGWSLRINGMVENPLTITYDELLAMPMVEADITLGCVSNEVGGDLVGAARWQGVLVSDLLRRASPHRDADMVLSSGPDGFTASTPLDVLLDGRSAMIAVAMNGEPLTRVHGFPARLVTPGLYGFVGATKWLSQLKVTRFDRDTAYWTTRGWSARGPVKTASRIDTPTRGASLAAGATTIGGVAWATHRGISAVEVQVDSGDWQKATLGPDVGVDYWRQWALPWDATPGRHTLRVRAVETDGTVQTAAPAPLAPDGASGHHTIAVTVT